MPRPQFVQLVLELMILGHPINLVLALQIEHRGEIQLRELPTAASASSTGHAVFIGKHYGWWVVSGKFQSNLPRQVTRQRFSYVHLTAPAFMEKWPFLGTVS